MLSSFNIIKNDYVISEKNLEITTKFESHISKEKKEEDEAFTKEHIEDYENLAKNMLDGARIQSEKIVREAYKKAEEIEENCKLKSNDIMKEAYEKAYKEGSEKGYNDAYEKTMPKVLAEAEKIKKDADNVLVSAQNEYKDYLEIKKTEIIDLIAKFTEAVLCKEVKDKESINNMVYEAISNAKNAKNFVIKCNSEYSDEIKNQILIWKEQLAFTGDVFVIGDNSISLGNAIIEKDNGKILVGIDIGMEKIKNILLENQI